MHAPIFFSFVRAFTLDKIATIIDDIVRRKSMWRWWCAQNRSPQPIINCGILSGTTRIRLHDARYEWTWVVAGVVWEPIDSATWVSIGFRVYTFNDTLRRIASRFNCMSLVVMDVNWLHAIVRWKNSFGKVMQIILLRKVWSIRISKIFLLYGISSVQAQYL